MNIAEICKLNLIYIARDATLSRSNTISNLQDAKTDIMSFFIILKHFSGIKRGVIKANNVLIGNFAISIGFMV